MDDRTFLRKWVAANGLAEAAGLGTTFVLGTTVAPLIEVERGAAGVLGVALLAVLLGTFLEGVVVGLAQGVVLEARHPAIGRRRWVVATSVGAGLAWLVGMIPGTAMALSTPAVPEVAIQEPALFVQLVLAAGLGLVAGPILGGAQWVVLKRHLPRSGSWLWANALAWALGMPAIFVGMNLVPWTGHPMLRALGIYLVCLVAGLLVGLVHGNVLMRLTRTPGPAVGTAGSR